MENLSSLSVASLESIAVVGTFIGVYLARTGREKSALTLYHECLEVVKFIPPGWITEALKGLIYKYIGMACCTMFEVKEAIKYMEMSASIQKASPNIFPTKHTFSTYHILGSMYMHDSDFGKALECFESSLEYAKGSIQKSEAYTDISLTYDELYDKEKAAEYMKKSKDIVQTETTQKCEKIRLICEGNILQASGDPGKAVPCFKQALVISQEMGDKLGECQVNQQLGQAYFDMSDIQEATNCYELALSLAKELRYDEIQGKLCNELGLLYLSLGDARKAIHSMELVPISKWLRCTPTCRMLYFIMGFLSEKHNDFIEGAIICYEMCITSCEEVEELLGNKDEHKVSISDLHSAVYCSLSRALIKDKQEMKALVIADRGRTRALADLMRSNYGIQTTNGPQGKMLSHNEIQQTAAMASRNTFFVISIDWFRVYMWVLGPDGSIILRDTTTEPQEMKPIQCIKRIVNKVYDELGVHEVQVNCDDRSLPDLYNAQDEFNPREPQPTPRSSVDLLWREALARDPSLSSPEPKYMVGTSLTALYDLIIAPVADLLNDGNKDDTTEELVFAPDGPLCLAPFAALQGPDGTHLCDKFRIRVIPSLTTLNHIQNCPAGYHSNTGALIVGDPSVGHVHYNGTEIHIGRLPAARKEAKMIGALLKVEPLTGDKATKEEVLNRMASVSLVHLAAHGHPDRGEIALAPNPSARSGIIEEKDYLLSMADVLSAKLRAKLVVLSCCHSGRGEIKAEGVVGIARAFLGAGARSVLVSLWAIDDEATLYFMQHFYQHLVQGESASAALHQATRELKHSENFSETRHWAPFLLIGDDVKISV